MPCAFLALAIASQPRLRTGTKRAVHLDLKEMVRDAVAGGIEVFMLRRTFNAAFASGMFVFPGGKVDDVDGVDEIASICDGLTDDYASSLLGIPSGGLAYWVACIRECFEEAGVFDPATGRLFREQILEVGGSRPALESFRAFRGRDPQIDAMLRHQGLVEA